MLTKKSSGRSKASRIFAIRKNRAPFARRLFWGKEFNMEKSWNKRQSCVSVGSPEAKP